VAIYSISRSFTWQGRITEKVASVCRMFGLTTDRLGERRFTHECQLVIEAGDIVYLTGPSGAGKSVLLDELEESIACDGSTRRRGLRLSSLPGWKPCQPTMLCCSRLSTG
jgi:ABC-type ATPase with predicted acetyltransferase domain